MNIKNKVREKCFRRKLTKKVYCMISYIKWKIYCGITLVAPIIKYRLANDTPVFLIFTPEHANLGDHAIAYSEQEMLKRLQMDYYEVTGAQLYQLHKYQYLKLLDNSTIFVNGGGNLGTLWPDIEKMNRWIISELQRSTICIMPNSIYYEQNENGYRELQKSQEIYNNHPRLYLYARERKSYEIMRKVYKNVRLVPDMVLRLDESVTQMQRRGCLICLRNDVERTVTKQEQQELHHIAGELFEAVNTTKTVLDYNVSLPQRKKELQKKFDEFKQAELVITDRLHGMIFCAITGTKCIVLDGKSPKISGCFEWIKDLEYIAFVKNVEDVKKVYRSMPTYPVYYNDKKIKPLFQGLEEDMIHLIKCGEWKHEL